jgi:DNA-binding NtrC family response regulator
MNLLSNSPEILAEINKQNSFHFTQKEEHIKKFSQGGRNMKIRVLLVDDEEEFAQALSERLALRDYDITTSLTGDDALEKIKQFNYDVVILDVAMPGMGGVEALREIKKLKPLTEVIMLTGQGTVETAIEGMKLGAFDFLMKPCKTEELDAKIKIAFARKAEHEERIRAAKVDDIISSPRSVLKDD